MPQCKYIGSGQKETVTGSVSLNNLTITSIKNATVMCNNTGMVFCNLCDDITIIAITWDKCGNIDFPRTGGIVLNSASNISIINSTFQSFTMSYIALDISYPTGNINLINSKFAFNTVSNISLYEGNYYCSLRIFQAKSTANVFISNSLFYFNGNTNQQSYSLNGSLLYYNDATYLTALLIRNTGFIFNGIRPGVYILQ